MPLQGCIKMSHFLLHIFKPVFGALNRRRGDAHNQMKRWCGLLIHPCNCARSYSSPSHLNCLQMTEPKIIPIAWPITYSTIVTTSPLIKSRRRSHLVPFLGNNGQINERTMSWLDNWRVGGRLPDTPCRRTVMSTLPVGCFDCYNLLTWNLDASDSFRGLQYITSAFNPLFSHT